MVTIFNQNEINQIKMKALNIHVIFLIFFYFLKFGIHKRVSFPYSLII